jgi:hypothetical protein
VVEIEDHGPRHGLHATESDPQCRCRHNADPTGPAGVARRASIECVRCRHADVRPLACPRSSPGRQHLHA